MIAFKIKSANVTSANLAVGTAVCVALVASVLGVTVDFGGRGPDGMASGMASGWNLRGPLSASDVPLPKIPKAVQVLPGMHLA